MDEQEFPDLMERLGLGGRHSAYNTRADGAFLGLAEELPVLVPASSSSTSILEKVYVAAFKAMLKKLADAAKVTLALVPEYSKLSFLVLDGQAKSYCSQDLRPDLLFFERNTKKLRFTTAHILLEAKRQMDEDEAYSEHLGQVAQYALALKTAQPMRRYIPILFLYGCQLDLLVFTNSGYFKTDIGPVLHDNADFKPVRTNLVSKSLQRLWFLLSLPPSDFGHLFPTPGVPLGLYIDNTGIADTSSYACPAILTDESTATSRRLTNVKLIDKKVNIIGRCTFLFTATHTNTAVVFKMMWIRTNHLPEGAVYKILMDNGVPNILTIYDSGVLVADIGGYCLEYLVMEHCGTPIVEHILQMRTNNTPAPEVAKFARDCVSTVTKTLAAALRAKVLHRDISPGNIAVKGNRIFVIDWGCAKFVDPPTPEQAADITLRWGFDCSDVVNQGGEKDPFTGTPPYMSIQMLLKVARRGIFNDIESLFYVVLDALSDRPRDDQAKNPPGFQVACMQSAAFIRLGCLCSKARYLQNFGVNALNEFVPKDMLDAMYQFLFFEGDRFIGDKLQIEIGCEREFDADAASRFMDESTIASLNTTHSRQQTALTPARSENSSPNETPEVTMMATDIQSLQPISRFSLAEPAIILTDSGMLVDQPLGSDMNDFSEAVGPVAAKSTTHKIKLHRSTPTMTLDKPALSSADKFKLLVLKVGQRKLVAPAGKPSTSTKNDKRGRDDGHKDTAAPTTMSPEQRVNTVFELLETASKKKHVGGKTTELVHALQVTQLAKNDSADEETILAALMVNVGRLIPSMEQRSIPRFVYDPTDILTEKPEISNDIDHGRVGGEYLRQFGFSKKTCELIESQVLAKRYLSTIDPNFNADGYLILPFPLFTLPTERHVFEKDPLFKQKVQLMKWDDAASKAIASNLPALDIYRDMAIRNLKPVV
ncbi:hypothetical protein GGI17_002138 [Coemansia sp. S146]|nr:hypothetical protein GGI17_002138 [Coemansia sp. S146]